MTKALAQAGAFCYTYLTDMISELTRKRMRESHLGKPGYWTGKKRPDISRIRTGMKFSDEHRKKISDYQRGRIRKPHSQITKDKIAERLTGNKNSLGRKRSKEYIEKIRQRMLGTHPTEETRLKFVKRMTGKTGILSIHFKGGRPKCLDCGVLLGGYYGKRCRKCNSVLKTGSLSPNWKGGITPINLKIRSSYEYSVWEKSVFKRDKYCCKRCGCDYKSKLVGHHILNFSHYLNLRLDIKNGITFCRSCHKDFHHIYGVKNNNFKQVIEFLLL